MGRQEAASRKRTRAVQLQQVVLGTIAAAGIIAVGAMAPNVLSGLEKLGMLPKPRQGEYIAAARRRLKKRGLLAEEDGFLRLTAAGQRELDKLSLLDGSRISHPRRWDQRWRVLIFDIPERKRGVRDAVRFRLRAAGFLRAQDSVWIFPYPCEEFVALLKAECKIGKDLLYMIVDSIENDGKYRDAFDLPRDTHSR